MLSPYRVGCGYISLKQLQAVLILGAIGGAHGYAHKLDAPAGFENLSYELKIPSGRVSVRLGTLR